MNAFLKFLTEYLPGILIGAWTGYITNDLALRMIFKEYRLGIFRVGGVIMRTRAEFTKGVADLVDEELIRPETLRERIGSAQFKDAAAGILADAAGRALTAAERYETIYDFIMGCAGAGGDGFAPLAKGGIAPATSPPLLKGGWRQQDLRRQGGFTAGSHGGLARAGADGDARVIERLSGILLDTLAYDCGALWEKAVRAVISNPAVAGMAGRLTADIIESPVFRRACQDFMASCGRVRIRPLLGDRYFSDIKTRAINSITEIAAVLSVGDEPGARDFADRITGLLIDARVPLRFADAVKNRTVADILNLSDLSAWQVFLERRIAGAKPAQDGQYTQFSPSNYVFDIISALLNNDYFCGVKPGDLIVTGLSGLDAAFTGIYAQLTGFLHDMLDEGRTELSAMMETSLGYALALYEGKKTGVASYARRAVFAGSIDRYKVYSRFADFLTGRCADLSGKHIAAGLIEGLFSQTISDLAQLDLIQEGLFKRLSEGGRPDTARLNADALSYAARLLGGLPGIFLRIVPSDAIYALNKDDLDNATEAMGRICGTALCNAITGGNNGAFFNMLRAVLPSVIDDIGEVNFTAAVKTLTGADDVAGMGAGTGAGQNSKKTLHINLPDVVKRAVTWLGANAPVNAAGKPVAEAIRRLITGPVKPKCAHVLQKGISGVLSRITTKGTAAVIRKKLDGLQEKIKTSGILTSIFDFLSGRLESTVQNSVNNAIKRKLDDYKDDELSSLARTFFGQLKHIAILGAVMGAAIGAFSSALAQAPKATAAFGDSSAASIMPLLINVALFALIGWVTNVAALELLFRPRREIKLPGITLQSVISRNRQRFAGAVGRFLSTLTETRAVDGAGDSTGDKAGAMAGAGDASGAFSPARLTEALTVQIQRAIPPLVKEYGSQGDKIRVAAKWIESAIQPAIIKNAGILSNYITDSLIRAAGTPTDAAGAPTAAAKAHTAAADARGSDSADARENTAADAPTAAADARESDSAGESENTDADDDYDWVSDMLAHILSAEIPISGILAALGPGLIESAIREWLYGVDSIELRSPIRRAAIMAYGRFMGRNADKPLLPPRDTLHGMSARALRSRFAAGQAKRALDAAQNPENSPAYQFVTRLLSNAYRENAPELCKAIRRLCISALIKHSDDIAAKLPEGIIGGTGFFTSFAFRMADGAGIVKAAAQNFIAVQLPAYVERHADKIDEAIDRLCRQVLRAIGQPHFLQRFFRPDAGRVAGLLDTLLNDSRVVYTAAEFLSGAASVLLGGVTFGQAAELFGFDGERGAAVRIDALIRPVSEALAENARIEAADLAREISGFALKTLEGAGDRLTVSSIFGGASRVDLAVITELLSKSFFSGDKAGKLWKECAGNRLVAERDLMGSVLASAIRAVFSGSSAENSDEPVIVPGLLDATAGFIERASDGFDGMWAGAFSQGASQLIAGAGVDALFAGMGDIMRAIDLQAVAEERINAMDTRSIERVFRSFAERYIRRLKLYGLWGGLFGIHPALPVAAAVAAFAQHLNSHRPKKYLSH